MPRSSARKRVLLELRQCMQPAEMLVAMDSDSDDEAQTFEQLQSIEGAESDSTRELMKIALKDDSDSEPEGAAIYQHLGNTHWTVLNSRYLLPRQRIGRSQEYVYDYFLSQSPEDFRCITRLTREMFDIVCELIEGDPIFHNNSSCPQAPVHWQLACALDRLGNDGQGVGIARSKLIWGLGHGTVYLYYRRVLVALNNLRTRFITWPDRIHRVQTANFMERKGFKGAVGFVDGTTFPLHAKPTWCGHKYMDRKRAYSVSAQVVCDHRHRIIHFMTWMPGSVHDSRYFAQSPLWRNPASCFCLGQYLIADSAYAATPYVVPAYKSNSRDLGTEDEQMLIETFNLHLARARVVNEHCIGILKSRWSSLRGLRICIRDPRDVFKVMQHTVACVVLHNICLEADPWLDNKVLQRTSIDDEDVPSSFQDRNRGRTPGQEKRLQVRIACLAWHAARNT